MKKQKPKSKRKEIEKELDKVWREKVLQRDRYRCRVCGKNDRLQAHHIFTRSRKNTRWDLENGVTLCAGHHYWAHREPERFREFVIQQIGEGKYQELYRKSQEQFSMSLDELELLLQKLKNS